MGTVETRNTIHNTINNISPEKLNAVLSFLEDLQKSGEEETAILMADPDFVKDYQEAKEDIQNSQTVNFKAIRRNV